MAESINVPSGPNNLRNSLVDMLSTRNLDMKGRRVVNASQAQDRNDYVILDQLNALQSIIDGILNMLKSALKTTSGSGSSTTLVVSKIMPPVDTVTALQITRADGTVIINFDNINNTVTITDDIINLGIATSRLSFFGGLPVVQQVLMHFTPGTPSDPDIINLQNAIIDLRERLQATNLVR